MDRTAGWFNMASQASCTVGGLHPGLRVMARPTREGAGLLADRTVSTITSGTRGKNLVARVRPELHDMVQVFRWVLVVRVVWIFDLIKVIGSRGSANRFHLV